MKKYYLFILLVAFVASGNKAWAQSGVGIGVINPDASAVLHVQPPSNNKGLLIPRLTTLERNSIGAPAEGLLVYDTDAKGFYFRSSAIWYSLNGWVKASNSNDVSQTGNASVSGTLSATAISSGSLTNSGSLSTNMLTSSGNISAGSLNVAGFSTNALVPSGVVVMWSGSVASVPSGWRLCDGVGGTPDLRDRFIVGAGNSYNPGNIGGANTVTLSVNEIPSHTHDVLGQTGGDNNDNNNTSRFAGGDKGPTESAFFFTGVTQSKGGDQPHENRPPYYALAYIMKL